MPRLFREFEDETDCLIEDLGRRYQDALKRACDGYKRNVEMMAEVHRNDPDFKVMYQHKFTKRMPTNNKDTQYIIANKSTIYYKMVHCLQRTPSCHLPTAMPAH